MATGVHTGTATVTTRTPIPMPISRIAMTDEVLTLSAWLSPAYPVGAYTYSHGIEHAVESGAVRDGATTGAWIRDSLSVGAGRTDAILLADAWRLAGDEAGLDDLSELAGALASSFERLTETQDQGAAFAAVTAWAWNDPASQAAPYPIALGAAAGRAGFALDTVLAMFLQAWAANLVSAAVRLVPLGQTEGARIVADLQPLVLAVACEAAKGSLDEIGSAAILSDIASMRHEAQTTRLFRT